VIPHNAPTLGRAETAAAADVISSGWVAQGPKVKAFEERIAQTLGLEEGGVVALSSGTAALFVLLRHLEVCGTTVVMPTYACSALRNAAVWAGATPSYVDCGLGSPNAEFGDSVPEGAEVFVAVSSFGIPCDLPTGTKTVVDDACQALGSTVGGTAVGLRTGLGVLSFSASKLITSGGQGGAIVSSDPALIDAVRDFREFDCRRDDKIRFNLQMTDLQAAIGEVQLRRLPQFLERREEIFQTYASAGVHLLGPVGSDFDVVARYRAVVLVKDQSAALSKLWENGVRAIVPIEKWELLDRHSWHPHAEDLTQRAVSLPIYPGLSNSKVAEVIAALDGVL